MSSKTPIPFQWDANIWLEDIVTTLSLNDRLAKLPPPGELLWHYTTIDGFKNIIKGKVRLNPLNRMNHSQEGKWLSSHLASHLRTDEDWRGGLLSSAVHSPPFSATFSFSLSKNRDLLSQWGYYANGGRGIAIGFDPMLLGDACQPVSERKASGGSSHFFEVEYKSSDEMKGIAKKIADSVKQVEGDLKTYLDQFLPSRRYGPHRQAHRAEAGIKRTINLLDTVFKNDAFYQEEEWRVVYFEESRRLYVPTEGPPDLDYWFTDNDIVQHYLLDIKESIKALTIGPICRTDPTAMKLFLQKEDLGKFGTLNDITVSKATLQMR
jgi:hypothetical protein